MIVPKSIVCYCRRQLTELQGETNTQISKLPLHIVQQTQSSTVIPTFQRSKHKEFFKADSHWFGTNVNINVNVLLVCWELWFQGLPQWPWIHSDTPPPSAHPCTCRHSVGYCLMRMRISLYQGKHWCSSAIVLIVSPRSVIPVWLSFIHLCDWACVRVCVFVLGECLQVLLHMANCSYICIQTCKHAPASLSSRCIKSPLNAHKC